MGNTEKNKTPEATTEPSRSKPVRRSKWPNAITLCTSDEFDQGTDARMSISPMGKFVDLEVEYSDYYKSSYNSLSIDKDMAVKIVNYLKEYFEI